MNQHRLFFSVLLIVVCTAVATGQQNFSTLDAFKSSVGRGEDRISVEATGDLNGDNLEDWTGVVHRKKSDASPTYQLYVLIRQPRGGYQVAQRSREEEIPGMGCCWVCCCGGVGAPYSSFDGETGTNGRPTGSGP